jgi:hypothetical protein
MPMVTAMGIGSLAFVLAVMSQSISVNRHPKSFLVFHQQAVHAHVLIASGAILGDAAVKGAKVGTGVFFMPHGVGNFRYPPPVLVNSRSAF